MLMGSSYSGQKVFYIIIFLLSIFQLSQYEDAVHRLQEELMDERQAHKMCADEVGLLLFEFLY